jgi:hypothetical protein
VGRAVGFLSASPPLGEPDDYARACHRAIDQACRLLGAKVTPGFGGPAGEVASRPCLGIDWFLAERTRGKSTDPEGAAFNPDAMSQAPAPGLPKLPNPPLQTDGRVGRYALSRARR